MDTAPDRLRLVSDLREAVRRNGLVLRYRRIVALATGRISEAEALLHWPHRRQTHRMTANFLPLAEEAGLTVRLGAWSLRRAAREAAGWPVPLPVSVDVSARQFAGGTLVGQVAAALGESGLSPERLALDLTQQTPLPTDDDDVVLTLAALRDQGISIALCDFGAGSANLAHLKRLPISALKLHRSLMAGVPREAVDTGMLRAAAEAGRALDVPVTADGVETEAQRDFLADIGIDRAQGALFGKAMPHDELWEPARVAEFSAG